MAVHDQRFKTLLREFLPEFLRLFFPERAEAFDLTRIEWLPMEILVEPPLGEALEIDLLAKLPLRSAAGETLALIHIEVESPDGAADMPQRMFQYFRGIRRDYLDLLLPIAVYLRVGYEGIGVKSHVEQIAGLEVLRFQYLYVGLPALTAEDYVAGSNWLGVALAALMRVPRQRKTRLRAEALRRILLEYTENDYRRFLLQECVEAYIQLSEQEQQEFELLLHTEPYKEIEAMMVTTFEKGVAKGRQEGLEEGQRKTARVQLERRFGPLSAKVLRRLESWPAERLTDLLLAILDAPSLLALGLDAEDERSGN
ncbi:MAG: hypothetical protein ACRELG_20915 [Gemmataceae bacterium]